MNLVLSAAEIAAENPFKDYLGRKAGLLFLVLVGGVFISAGAWFLNNRTDVDLPAGVIVWPGTAAALSLVLLVASI